MFWQRQWGTVCDDLFDNIDGAVICKYLGFPGVQTTYHRAHFGQGSGLILFDNMQCAGNEYGPFSCPMNAIGQHNCGHHEDASVTCQSKHIAIMCNY